MNPGNSIPLAAVADAALTRLAAASGAARLRALDGATLLGERAVRADMRIPGRTSAGGGCRLFDAQGDTIAINLARTADREMLPALFEDEQLDARDDAAIAARIRRTDAHELLSRGRSMGLAMAAEHERRPVPEREPLPGSGACAAGARGAPRVVDLSALWAGPLAAHLLWLAGAHVVKVESRLRPDAMRNAPGDFYDLLNQGKTVVAVDLDDAADRRALLALIAASDIVIEAARPRALEHFGIDVDALVRNTPGLNWIRITAHGARGEAADWVGFGDDCGVAGGLSAALRRATGRSGFVGDAIADPLTGIFAALAAWEGFCSGRGARLDLAMSAVVARCIATARRENPQALQASLQNWADACGRPFPHVARRAVRARPASCGDIRAYVAQTAR